MIEEKSIKSKTSKVGISILTFFLIIGNLSIILGKYFQYLLVSDLETVACLVAYSIAICLVTVSYKAVMETDW